MKNKKLISALVLAWIISGASATSLAFGNSINSMNNNQFNRGNQQMSDFVWPKFSWDYTQTEATWTTENFKLNREEVRTRIREMKKEKINHIKQHRDEMKKYKDNFKDKRINIHNEFKNKIKTWVVLDENLKEEIYEIRKEFRKKMTELIQKLRQTKDISERKEIFEEMNKLRQEYQAKIIEKTQWTEYWKILKEKFEKINQLRNERFNKINEVRDQIKQVREDFRKERDELKAKFKTIILERYKDKINKFSLEKLKKIKERISKIKEKFENKNISENTRLRLEAVLEAVNDIVTKRIEKLKNQTTDINENEILNDLFK